MATVQTHLAISERFLNHGITEVAAGDLLQGSEKLWGTAAHLLKAVAEQRGWRHSSHGDLYRANNRIVRETGDESLDFAFQSANRLHQNFYKGTLAPSEIDQRALQVEDLVETLHSFVLAWD